jgi:hypothetical protein
MKVLVGPGADPSSDPVIAVAAHVLAGPEGEVVRLTDVGVRNLSRPMSAAEIALLRRTLVGEQAVVGYLCPGKRVPGWDEKDGEDGAEIAGAGATPPDRRVARLVIVTDHANLTWRSPLTGPNDDTVGPRFPSMTGIYAPEVALNRLGLLDGIIVRSGIVAGVVDHDHPTAFEAGVAQRQGYVAVSCELVPVVIVAAHMGLRVAAVAVMAEPEGKGEG